MEVQFIHDEMAIILITKVSYLKILVQDGSILSLARNKSKLCVVEVSLIDNVPCDYLLNTTRTKNVETTAYSNSRQTWFNRLENACKENFAHDITRGFGSIVVNALSHSNYFSTSTDLRHLYYIQKLLSFFSHCTKAEK